MNNYNIREIEKSEYPLLEEFLYEAIFQKDENKLLPRDVINQPSLKIYIEDFGKKDDLCLVAETNGKVIGAAWTRIIDAFGSVDSSTPEFAISLYRKYRGHGIGSDLMKKMLQALKEKGYSKTSLAVQKENYALKMYQNVGFEIVRENSEEYIMVCDLK